MNFSYVLIVRSNLNTKARMTDLTMAFRYCTNIMFRHAASLCKSKMLHGHFFRTTGERLLNHSLPTSDIFLRLHSISSPSMP